MCGIAGIFNLSKSVKIDVENFYDSLSLMKYRGPDATGIRLLEDSGILGHVRLSIIDTTEENNQPFAADDNYTLIYNGEIYNYIELREELEMFGYSFKTRGDTEVLLRSYQHWGDDCVNHFNGMWALAIYNKSLNKLFCSRDRFGIKPFNYAEVNGQFIFSSEIKVILSYFPCLRMPNYEVISNYCRKTIGAQIRNTWFRDIFRLEPGHNLVIENAKISLKRYWDYPRKINRNISFDEAVKKYKEILSDAVHLRMRSDVPVGFTLSSGVDSTSLVCLLKGQFFGNKNTYTAAFNENKFDKLERQGFAKKVEVNEGQLVKELTAQLDLTSHIIEIDYENYVERLSRIIYHLESGHGSPAIIPLSQILSVAKEKVTVLLEGQGADELLGGYINSAMPVYLLELIRKLKLKQAYKEFIIFSKTYSIKTAFALLIRQSHLKFIKKIYYALSSNNSLYLNELADFKEIDDSPGNPAGFDSFLNKHLYEAHTGTLVNLLHYGDAVSMSHSLESRLPFMDYRLVEFAFSLPSDFKIRNGLGKYIHRVALKGIVPDFILENPYKFGFTTPLVHLFNSEEEKAPKSILMSERCLNRKLFSKTWLMKAFDEQASGKKDHSRILFRILCVELWFREFIDNEFESKISAGKVVKSIKV